MGTSITINITGNARNAQQVIAQVRQALALLNQQQAQNTRQANAFNLSIRNLRNQLFALKLAFEGAQFFGRLISEGLKFNQVVETGTLAVATLITATGRLVDNEGRVLVGTEALAEGMKIAADQVNKLRVDGLRTAATTEQLIDAFQQATAAGIAAGLTLDQIRRTTVQIVLAAGNLGIPMNQLNQEVRSILEATIDRNSRVAKILQITNAEIKANREAGTLAEFLNQKLQAFTVASEKAADTWSVVKSNMVEALQVLAGDVTKPFFDSLKRGFKGVLDNLFDFDRAAISKSFSGLIEGGQAFFAEFGKIVEQAISTAVRGAQSLSEWFKANRTEVTLFVKELGETVVAIGSVIGQVVKVLAGIVKWGIESGAFVGALNTIQSILKILEKLVAVALVGSLIKATAGAVGLATAIGRAVIGITGLGAAFKSVGSLRILSGISGPIGATVLAITGLVAVLDILKGRQDIIRAQKQALLDTMARERGEAIELSRSYVEMSDNVVNGTATHQDLASTLQSLAGITDDLSKKNDAFSATATDHALALRKIAAAITENVRKQQDLTAEQLKLEAALRDSDTKGPGRIKVQERLAVVARELGGLQKTYNGLVKDATDAVKEHTQVQLDAAQASLISARALFQNANAVNLQLMQQRAALENELEGLPIGASTTPLKRKLANLDQAILAYEHHVAALFTSSEIARKELEKLQEAMQEAGGVKVLSPTGAPDVSGAAKQRENDLKQSIEAQIEVIKAGEKRIVAELKESLEDNKTSIAQFTQDLLKSQIGAIDQIIVLRKQLMNALSDEGDKAQQAGEIRELMELRLQVIADANRNQLKMTKDLKDDELKVRQEWLEATGQLAAAAAIEIERKFGEMIARMRANGSNEVEIALQLKGFAQIKAGIDDLMVDVKRGQQELDTELTNIQARVAAGALAPLDAQKQVIAAYQRMQGVIDGVRAKLLLSAVILKDPSLILVVQALTEEWNRNTEAISNAREEMNKFQIALFDAVQSGFVQFLTFETSALEDSASTWKQYRQALRDTAADVARSIRQMIAQMIAFKAASAIFSVLGFAAPASTNRFGLARGGYITGPGTSTSDSIPARLSHGEYVLSARTVKNIGVGLLDQLNFGASRVRLRKKNSFSQGGLVEGEATQGARGELSATIGLEDGLVFKTLNSSKGLRLFLKIVSKNPKAFKAALTTG